MQPHFSTPSSLNPRARLGWRRFTATSQLAPFFIQFRSVRTRCWLPVQHKQLGRKLELHYQMIMSAIEQDLLITLTELDQAVKSMAAANPKPTLLPLFARIDQLTRQLPPGADPALLHYLNKKSYEKARLLLQGRDEQNAAGNCRH